jgi:hypothetical protein
MEQAATNFGKICVKIEEMPIQWRVPYNQNKMYIIMYIMYIKMYNETDQKFVPKSGQLIFPFLPNKGMWKNAPLSIKFLHALKGNLHTRHHFCPERVP